MRKYTIILLSIAYILYLLVGCASSYEDSLKAETAHKKRVDEQQKHAREADQDLQKATE